MNRPLVWVAMAWAVGILAAHEGYLNGVVAPLAIGLLGLLIAVRFHYKPWLRPVAAVLCFVAVGSLLWSLNHAGSPGDPLFRFMAQEDVRSGVVEGRVRRSALYVEGSDNLELIVDVDNVTIGDTQKPLKGRVALSWHQPAFPVFTGERVRAQGRVELKLSSSNPGVYEPEDHLRANHVYTRLVANGASAVTVLPSSERWSPAYWASRLRAKEGQWVAQTVPPGIRPLVYAVWLGERGLFNREDYARFRQAGIAHILAVSGVHVGIIFVSTAFLLQLFMSSRRRRALIAMIVVVAFALVTGASVTSLRAALMIAIYLVAELFDREPDTPSALAFSAILFLVTNPDTLFHIGFQLSYASVASILLFTHRLEDLLGIVPTPLRQAIAVSLAVQILPVPLAAYYFHVLPVAGPIVNLIAVPLVTVVLWLSFLLTVSAGVSIELATVFGHAMLPAVYGIQIAAAWGANIQWHVPTITSPTPIAAVAYLAAVLLAMAIRGSIRSGPSRMAMKAAIVLLLAAGVLWQPWHREPEVFFLDVGHGDATFIRSPAGKTALVDAGDRNEYIDYGERVVAPYLWSQGVRCVDYLILTHPDSDHVGGALYLLENMEVGQVLMGPVPGDSPLENELLDTCARRTVPVRRVAAGDAIDLGGASFDVLHPPQEWPGPHSDNDLSLVLRLDWGPLRVQLPGDLEAQGERLVAQSDCAAQVLKAPHHGSGTSSTDVFLDATNPTHVVISTGTIGSRDAVSQLVLEQCRRRGITVWRTDDLGGICLRLTERGPHFEGTRR